MNNKDRTLLFLKSCQGIRLYIANLQETIQHEYETAVPWFPAYAFRVSGGDMDKLEPGAVLAEKVDFQALKLHCRQEQFKLRMLDRALGTMPMELRTIVEKRHVEPRPMPWKELATLINYSIPQSKRLYLDAVLAISNTLFGVEENAYPSFD